MLPKKQKGRHPAGVAAFVFLLPIAFLGDSFFRMHNTCFLLVYRIFTVLLLLLFGNYGNLFQWTNVAYR